MVAKITVPNSIKRALNYNEQKMKEGKAICIYAHNFLKDAAHLNFYEKLQRFETLIALNKRASTNTVHISLNFGLNEKIGKEKLVKIASVYMQKIGFNDQPYLVYQHLDAAHPHIHIVTTNIQKDGRRISLHNIGRNQSAQARKEIEIAYSLVKAEQQKQQSDEIKPVHVQKVVYGKSETKRSIANALNAVINQYKYSSLAELNAVLKLYNITADRGKEDGIIFRKNGLVYRVLDDKGNKIGVPVKASSIYNKPTLPFLETKFKENELLKHEYKKKLKTAVDWILIKPPKDIQQFKDILQKDKISLMVRQNDNGIIYGLTYIDHNTKCVFNGSSIGKEYSAKAILEKCTQPQVLQPSKTGQDNSPSISNENRQIQEINIHQEANKVLDAIITPAKAFDYVPNSLKKRRKKKLRQ